MRNRNATRVAAAEYERAAHQNGFTARRTAPSTTDQIAGLGLFAQEGAPGADRVVTSAASARAREREMLAGLGAQQRALVSSPTMSAAAKSQLVLDLTRLMRKLARERDDVTIAELRDAAVQEKLITGREKGRELSFLGGIPRKAGLVPVPGVFRRSHTEGSHGNLQQVWTLGTLAQAQEPGSV